MRKFLVLFAAPVLLAGAGLPARADVTFDVPVDVSTLAADVDSISINCHTCAGDCGEGIGAPSAIQIDNGRNIHTFAPGQARTFKGTLTVVARTVRPGTATDYLCYMELRSSARPDFAELPRPTSTQTWARPKPGTAFTPYVKGKF